MSPGVLGVLVILMFNLALVIVLVQRPSLLWVAGGRVLVFLSLLVLPALSFAVGFLEHADHAKRTEFCVSCHVMEPYGLSLQIDSVDHLPASHFQNARVDQERACYVCHTNYSMFGDIRAKLNGLQHLYVNYLTGPPDEIALYQPFQNRECLYCHSTARSFEENDLHIDVRAELEQNDVSCLECHAVSHDIAELPNLKMWEPER